MDIATIRKRDGRIVLFDEGKIAFAIFKAARAVGGHDRKRANELAGKVTDLLKAQLGEGEIPTVEKVQDIVEKVLVDNGHYKTVKAYILYRKQHESLRTTKELFTNIDLIDSYLDSEDWRVKENANMAFSLQGLNCHISSIISSQYWLNKIYPPEIREAHTEGKFHLHDLGTLSVYCVGWDLQDLLLTGFKGVHGKIESKPAKHFRTILGQIINFFYTLQGEAAGAQAFSNFDTYIAPFIRFDNLEYSQVKQSLQEFMFNINVPTRVGFQTPFTNITLDLTVPDFMKDEPVIIGGEIQPEKYGDFQKEMDIFNKALAEVSLEGDAKGRVFTFPIPTINITKDFDWNNPSYEPIWQLTAKYGIPYFSNFINSDMSPDDVRSMCCRLRLDKRSLRKKGGGLFGANPLTGSIGVVTINLPQLGFLSKSETDFFQRLDKLMELASESLEIKRKVLENLTEKGLFPYSRFYLRYMKQRFGEYWKNHFSTIGIVGMNEACINFLGVPISDPEGAAFAHRVLDHMRQRLETYQQKHNTIYNLEATPAEGTSYRLARIDKKKYPDITTAGKSAPYYTNSTHLPVSHTDDIFEALRMQDPLQTKYTGGTVFHTFIGEELTPDGAKILVKKITENFHLPYITLTPTFSICPDHGYHAGEHYACPTCSCTCEVYSRIVGYLRPVGQWNAGKQEEFKERKEFLPHIEVMS
jgi:ribonucleoside-triphosphate reductase